MKKWWFLILILALLIYGCGNVSEEKPVLNELQTTACESASSNNNCDRLAELGIVTAADCCSALGKCCDGYVTGHVVDSGSLSEMQVSLNEFKVVLLGAIKSYFSSSSVLTTVELKDLIYAYFSAKDEMADLSGVGEYSKEKLIDIYNKVKGATPQTPGALSIITVLTPNAPMATYRAGETYEIRVLCKSITKVLNIFLIDERTTPPSREIMLDWVSCKNAQNEYEWTTYNWTIPLDITSDDRKFVFRIRAETLDSLVSDESNYSFSIDRPLPRITVLSPNGGETLTIGATSTLKWDSNLRWVWASTDPSVFSVLRLNVYGADGYYKGTIGDVWDTGSFIWTVGEVTVFGQKRTLPAGRYKIRIARVIKTEGSPRTYLDILDESDMPFNVVAAGSQPRLPTGS